MAKDRDNKSHAADMRPPPSDGGGMSTGVAIIGFILCFMAGGAVMWGFDSHRLKTAGGITADSSSPAGATWSDADSPIPVTSQDPVWGSRGAPVTIVTFSDFQCPFCSRVEPTVNEIMKTYGDKVKIVWRDKPLPMHPNAPLAAEAGREALKQKGSDGFWKMHNKMFENQQKLSREDLDSYAKDLGLDMDKFKAALDNHTHKAEVDADDKVGTDLGISGTPAFLVNGYYVSGAQPFPKFKKLIDRAMAEAK